MPIGEKLRPYIPTRAGTKAAVKALPKHPATYATLFAITNFLVPVLNRFAVAGAGFEAAKDDLIAFATAIGTNTTAWVDAKNAACMSIFVPEAGTDPALAGYPKIKALTDHASFANLARGLNGVTPYGTDIALGVVMLAVLLWNYRQTKSGPVVGKILDHTKSRTPMLKSPWTAACREKAKAGLKDFLITLGQLITHVPKLVWLYCAMILAVQYLTIFFTDEELGYTHAASAFCDASNNITVAQDFQGQNPFDVIDVKTSINDLMKFAFSALSSAATLIAPVLTLYLAAVRAAKTTQQGESRIQRIPAEDHGDSQPSDRLVNATEEDEDHLYGFFQAFKKRPSFRDDDSCLSCLPCFRNSASITF